MKYRLDPSVVDVLTRIDLRADNKKECYKSLIYKDL